jgi:RNA polymerase sigma-70 factor, ECF subfamily
MRRTVGEPAPSSGRPSTESFDLAQAADQVLAERAGDGDVRAFTVLVRRHGPALRRYATRVLGGTSESDDVVQETFVTAWTQLAGLQETAAVRGWLFRIAGRKAIDRLRAAKSHDEAREDLPAPVSDSPASRAQVGSLTGALSAALDGLPVDQRRAWLLRELGGQSYDDIAADLGVPTSTVRGLLARARKDLARRMEAWR